MQENEEREELDLTKYVYTEKGEAKAKEYGVEPRKAGDVAMFGYEPLEEGMVANAWLKKGYIEKVEG